MDELTIGDKVYISSKRAAKITGYAKDYVGQLCREGRVEARLVGRNWYVLESSITEHRFGVSEKEIPATPARKTDVGASESSISWSAPSYKAEVLVPVPSLLPKDQDVLGSRRVVSEMQTAWQEWFTQQNSPELLLEDSSEEFEGAYVPMIQAEEEGEEEVYISRLPAEEAEPVVEAPIVNHYSYGERLVAAAEVMDLSQARNESPMPVEKDEEEATERPEGSSLLLKSVLLGVAFIAACVALVGTGTIGDLVLGTQGSDSAQVKVIKFLGGETEYSNSK